MTGQIVPLGIVEATDMLQIMFLNAVSAKMS